MLNNQTEYKYDTPYKFHFVITQCLIDGTVNLQTGGTKIGYNTRRINPYKSDTKVEDYNSINMSDDVSI